MKKLLGIIVLGLLLSGNAYAADNVACTYKEVSEKIHPCDQTKYLKETLDSLFFDLLKPKEVSVDEWRNLILKRIKEWEAGAAKRDKEYEEDRKKRIDLKCEILGGQANNSNSAKKIYKKCMKSEGY